MRASNSFIAVLLIGMASTSMAQDEQAEAGPAQKNESEKSSRGSVAMLPDDLKILFPLTPEERITTRKRQLEDQNATYMPLREVKPIRDMRRISGNGEYFPTVYVTPDYPSTIVFTDITGKPWPIRFIGQTTSLATIEQPTGTDNSLVLQAKNGAGRKSIAVFLQDLTLPVTITIDGENTRYHALKHIQITERGPNSDDTTMVSQSSGRSLTQGKETETSTGRSMDTVLNYLAYDVTPEGFKKLKTSERAVDAWIDIEDPKSLYIKTRYTVVSPLPRNGSRSVTPLQDGLQISVLPRINPVMVLNEAGEKIYVQFKEAR
jgi:intracellular multiplication protein IcmK